MLRLLLLISLPVALYGYYRYWSKAPPEQRKRRTEVALWGVLAVLLIAFALRGGSPVGVSVGALVLALLRWASIKGIARYFGNKPAASDAAPRARAARMSAEEALEILGLEPGATAEQVQARYKQLMRGVHPDRGGSDFLAAQINTARDVLLAGFQGRP